MNPNVVRVLARVDENLREEKTWLQDRWWKQDMHGNKCMCLGYAIREAYAHVGLRNCDDDAAEAIRILAKACNQIAQPLAPLTIVGFNDSPGRTFAQVREAIELAKQMVGPA